MSRTVVSKEIKEALLSLPRVLVITFDPLDFDSRVIRQVESLSETFEVTLLAPKPHDASLLKASANLVSWEPGPIGLTGWNLGQALLRLISKFLLLFRAFKLYCWMPMLDSSRAHAALSAHGITRFDLVVVNEAAPLPLAFSISESVPVVADLHEFAPGRKPQTTLLQRAKNHYWEWICQTYLGKCSSITVVSEAVSTLYRAEFGVDSRVVRSTPWYQTLTPTIVQGGEIQLVHHGYYSPGRGVELIMEGFSKVHSVGVLNLVLRNAPLGRLKKLAQQLEIPEDRIVFHEFVEPKHLISFLNTFDIEIIFIPTDVVNELAALPNKFFEAVQARLAVLSGPTPEVTRIIESASIGGVVPSFEAAELARALQALTPEIVSRWKREANRLAGELNWEKEAPDYLGFQH